MLNPNSIKITKEQNDNVTIKIENEKSFNLLSESYLTKMIASVVIRGKGGERLYEFFYTEVDTVTRKDGTIVSITDNDILFDELNLFFFFINNDSGGGGGLTNLPVGNFLFVNPLGNDGTGLREDFAFPFLTLNAAKNAAIAGDTIFVYGGTYSATINLHKEGIKWHFIGKPIIIASVFSLWSDNGFGPNQKIDIQGDVIINQIAGIGFTIETVNQDTVVNANFTSINAKGGVFNLKGGSGNITVTEYARVSVIGGVLNLGGNSNYNVNIDEMSNASVTSISPVIACQNQLPLFTGKTIVNARIIRNDGTGGYGCVRMEYAQYSGTLIVNVSDKMIKTQPGANPIYPQNVSACFCMGGNLIVNGDIDGAVSMAINVSTNSFTKTITHNGKAYNDGTLELFGSGMDDIGFWLADKYILNLNGVYTSANQKVIRSRGTIANARLNMNGEIYSTYNNIGNSYGIFLELNVKTIINNLKIVSNNQGTPFGIGALIPRDIKITHNIASNVDVDGNITNLITGTQYIFDTDVE